MDHRRTPVLPPWPKHLKRTWHTVARFTVPLSRAEYQERWAEELALRNELVRASFTTGTCGECMWNNLTDGTANASTSSETAMMTGLTDQPWFPAGYFTQVAKGLGRRATLFAAGVASTTSTPTVVGQWRMGSTQGVTQTGGTSIAQNAALTCASGVSNLRWESRVDVVCRIAGMGSGNATINVSGYLGGPLFSNTQAQMVPASGSPAAWTVTFDATPAQYLVFNWTWGTSSASNTATLKEGYLIGW